MTELSTCDICNMPIAILINFLFLFSFFFFLLFHSSFTFFSLLKCFVTCNLFFKKKYSKMKEKNKIDTL